MKKIISILTITGLLLSGCSQKNQIDYTNPNLKVGKVTKSTPIDIDVDSVSKLTNAKLLGLDEDVVELSSSRGTHVLTGTLLLGLVGTMVSYGGSTMLGGNDVDAFKTNVITIKNESIDLILPIQLKENTTVEFEKNDNELVEFVRVKELSN